MTAFAGMPGPLLNLLPQRLKLDLAQVSPFFHQTQGITDTLAGAAVAPAFQLSLDELLKGFDDGLIGWHGGNSHQCVFAHLIEV